MHLQGVVAHPSGGARFAGQAALTAWNEPVYVLRDQERDVMTTFNNLVRANGTIVVSKYEPVAYDTPAEGPALMRIQVEERFSGDIEGDGMAQFLQVARADGSASFAGIERVAGIVAGREG